MAVHKQEDNSAEAEKARQQTAAHPRPCLWLTLPSEVCDRRLEVLEVLVMRRVPPARCRIREVTAERDRRTGWCPRSPRAHGNRNGTWYARCRQGYVGQKYEGRRCSCAATVRGETTRTGGHFGVVNNDDNKSSKGRIIPSPNARELVTIDRALERTAHGEGAPGTVHARRAPPFDRSCCPPVIPGSASRDAARVREVAGPGAK